MDKLCGTANVTNLVINDESSKALIDTGSTISTVSRSFYKSMSNMPQLHSLGNILDIEGATGHSLPYDGYIEARLRIPGLHINGPDALLLVVPDTNFNSTVPIIIGTNVIKPLKQLVMLDQHSLDNSWSSAFRCLAHPDNQLRKYDGRLAVVKSASKHTFTIPCNKTRLFLDL